MELIDLGWQQYFRKQHPILSGDLTVGRIGIENKTHSIVHSPEGDMQGIIQGKFRYQAKHATEYPKVGDWVVYDKLPGEQKAVIRQVLPRYSLIARKAAGDTTDAQIIAANVDVLFIVLGLDQDFNPPLLERYLTMAYEGGVEPIVILNKRDKVKFADSVKKQAEVVAPGVSVYVISAKDEFELHYIENIVEPGRTIAFVGPSGAGKSTLINALIGSSVQTTSDVRLSDNKGRHTTTRREMFVLKSGGILIDTPGIRELETLSSINTVKSLFTEMEVLAEQCRFRDCDHEHSRDCAILKALEAKTITKQRYNSYLKLLREAEFHSAKDDKDLAWKRKRQVKRANKALKRTTVRKKK